MVLAKPKTPMRAVGNPEWYRPGMWNQLKNMRHGTTLHGRGKNKKPKAHGITHHGKAGMHGQPARPDVWHNKDRGKIH